MRPSEICAVVVTHNPDRGFDQRLRITSEQVGHIVVVDNASASVRASALPGICRSLSSAEAVCLDSNTGVAAAQNTGIRRALGLGFQWTILLDQDSQPAADMVRKMAEAHQRQPANNRVAILAPNIADLEMGVIARFLRPRGPLLFERASCRDGQLDNVTIVIASGSLISNEIFQRLGPFREEYYIDYVDTEYCLRAVSQGYRIIAVCGAILFHQVDNPKRKKVGPLELYPRFHSPSRWYYIARNRLPTILRYGLHIPHWLLYEVMSSSYHLFRMLVAEDRRREKLQAIVAGTLDGMRGKMGPLPKERASRWN